jgi:hypothetical protein
MDNNNRNNMSREHRQRTRNSALASNNNGKIKRPFLKIIGLVFLVMIFVWVLMDLDFMLKHRIR